MKTGDAVVLSGFVIEPVGISAPPPPPTPATLVQAAEVQARFVTRTPPSSPHLSPFHPPYPPHYLSSSMQVQADEVQPDFVSAQLVVDEHRSKCSLCITASSLHEPITVEHATLRDRYGAPLRTHTHLHHP
jgi:hypothetical protein